MKQLVLAISLMTISITSFAQSKTSYDYRGVALLNAVKDCSAEIMKATMHHEMVLSAEESDETSAEGSVNRIDVLIGVRYAPFSPEERVMTKISVIHAALKANQIPAPDAPTIWEKTKCVVTPVR